ncbi:hypothetical protein VE03_02402 [Pseudogymnoascus sp. 23342-1-I1]|nr:hypothetical protein VE03_02402 [Pseudogymnoascus sp. 23342-1-I1]
MAISYDVSLETDQGVVTSRYPLRFIRLLLLHVPSDPALDGIVVNALQSIAHEPIGDVTVAEIRSFFAVLCCLHIDLQAPNIQREMLDFSWQIHVAAVVV